MNKRIKLKKGILHKKCDKRCFNYRIIVEEMFVTNNCCINCKLCGNEEISRITAENLILGRKYKRITKREAIKIIDTYEPRGLFWVKEYNKKAHLYIGIDNLTGDAWVEEFKTREECFKWLEGDE